MFVPEVRSFVPTHACDEAPRARGRQGWPSRLPYLLLRGSLIETYDVERILADINAGYADCSVEFLRHSVLLVLGAPLPA